jgi:acetyl-CoA carboxylase biotin carboxylase subunit
MFRKVLIANRGEIAVRITQTLQEMGINVVAIYAEADAKAPHVATADEAYPLSGQTPSETYLNVEKILGIAKSAGVEAIHPGYGFLSENANFAKACQAAGITFIGPSPEVITAMGDKIIAKAAMEKAGVPVVPGWTGDATRIDEIKQAAEKIGYPVLVKAAAGGGGKGMRLVHEPEELQAALEGAAREAKKAFGDDRIFLEKYVTRPRHIEFQIFGDSHGNVVHLFERECSIQRRHQKIIEESPSPALTPELREQMGSAAIKAAQAIGYTNAGTVEFILDVDNRFYFLEVNTRLQVEHPVTEWVTHQDLVRAQLYVAMGQPLPFTQADLSQDGHSIECRVYAEDPQNNFLPSTGTLHVYHEPSGPGIRVDSGVQEGGAVTVHYDPMLSKLIVWAKNRDAAMEKMLWALSHYPVLGVTTNIAFLHDIIAHPAFQSGDIDTHFLERYPVRDILSQGENQSMSLAIAAAALSQSSKAGAATQKSSSESVTTDPWLLAGAWRGV